MDKFDGEILVANSGSSLLRYANIIFFALTVIVNSLAGSTNIIGGRNTADVSNANSTLVTPAGYVFSIWGIIYILLGVFVVYQALPSEQGKDYQRKISWLFVLSSLVNIAWIFVWQFEYLSSVCFAYLCASGNVDLHLPAPWCRQVES